MGHKELVMLLTRLAISLGVELSLERMKIYLTELSDLDPAKLREALSVRQHSWFPAVKDIRALAGDARLRPAEEAEAVWFWIRNWPKALKDMPLEGVALAVVKAMGGRGEYPSSFGCWPADQEGFKKKEFVGRYMALLAGPIEAPPQISHEQAAKLLEQAKAGAVCHA